MHRYIEEERRILLGSLVHDALWVGKNGTQLELIGAAVAVNRATRTRFGTAFGPHRFRHELATALARDHPGNPGLAAAILGVSLRVVERYYTQALADEAALAVAEHLERERARMGPVAEWGFPSW